MKYKTLITGKNTTIIDDFFVQMDDNFEVVSTSTRFGDIMRHLKFYNPDLFVYCLSNEARESISQMVNIKQSLLQSRIPVVILGTKEECDEFEKIAVNVANLTLVKPFSAVSIQEKIVSFMDERQEYLDALAAEKEKAELERTARKFKGRVKSKEELESAFQSIANKITSLSGKEEKAEKAEKAEGQIPEAAQTHEMASETVNETETIKETEAAAPKEPETVNAAPAQRQHILVVDDDPLMLKMLKEHLHDDYDVATAVSGKIALKFLERKTTNLILLDYEMPGETGPEVLEKLRANEATKDLLIIFLTGVSDREKIQEALVLRPQSYLLKPIDREKLLESIHKVIG